MEGYISHTIEEHKGKLRLRVKYLSFHNGRPVRRSAESVHSTRKEVEQELNSQLYGKV